MKRLFFATLLVACAMPSVAQSSDGRVPPIPIEQWRKRKHDKDGRVRLPAPQAGSAATDGGRGNRTAGKARIGQAPAAPGEAVASAAAPAARGITLASGETVAPSFVTGARRRHCWPWRCAKP